MRTRILEPMRALLVSAMLASGFLLQCGGTQDAPPVFGGEGADVASNEVPLAEGQGEVASGPCANPAPVDTNTMFEDFEDGDNHLFKVFERDGWWFTATDETKGTVEPPRDAFRPKLLPEAEATTDNRYAAYLAASGFTDWGVVWGSTLEWRRDGVKCPFNASAFSGLRLRARGTGRIRVSMGIPATFPVDNGGTCKQGCYDTHGKMIDLTPEWTEYVVSFDKLQQNGWGAEARFTPDRLLALNFNANPPFQPVTLWVDDLAWVPVDAAGSSPSTSPSASAASMAPTAPSTASTTSLAPASGPAAAP